MARRLERQVAFAEAHGQHRMSAILRHAFDQLVNHDNAAFFGAIQRLKRLPVTIEEFVGSKEFMADMIEVWPSLLEDIVAINPDILTGAEAITEYLSGGATGTGKSTVALVTQAYQLYVLTCFNKPQIMYNLTDVTPIVFMFQSVGERVTKRVLYEPFRQMFTNMAYTRKWVPYDKYRDTTLDLDQNITVVPTLATVQNMVGQAIMSAILDEVNFMNIVENSRTVIGNRGFGGSYDQAEIVHRTITRRRKSRFISRGPVPGCIAVLSSTRYKNDFLDRRIAQVEKNKEVGTELNVLVFRRKQYEVQPSERYSGEKFRLLVGTDHWPTRILKDGEEEGVHYPEGATVEEVPMEYYNDFLNDPESALRDIIGTATDAISPFITQRHKIVDAIIRGRTRGLKQWVNKSNVVLAVDGMPQIVEENLPASRSAPRFVHIDLSINKDSCGIAISRVDGHTAVANDYGVVEQLPHVTLEMALTLEPSPQAEVDIAAVRNWVVNLKLFYGINIYSVTYDGFQSKESIQILRKAGIRSTEVSMDRTPEPYEELRSMYYHDRIDQVEHEGLRLELGQLEKNAKTGKIDHPPRGKKDVADAVAGSVFSAVRSRNVRADTGVSATVTSAESGRVKVVRRRRLRPKQT